MSKIASKIIAVVVTLLLAISFVVTGSFIQSVSQLAAESPETTFKTGVTNRVKYGQTFTVDANNGVKVSVKTPGGTYAVATDDTVLDGENAISANKTVKATQVGVYEITYSADKGNYASYTYNVESYMDYEYLFVVDGYGAAIPSYWGNEGKDIVLPSATLYYFDEDLEKYLPDTATSEIKCRVTIPGAAEETYTKAQLESAEGVKIKPANSGTYFFTYYAEVANGDNLFSEEYTMQVQDSFSDTKAPTLTISDVPSSSSSNTQIKLPVATVTDDYDTRVNTTITVKYDYGNGLVDVPEAVIDQDTGYVAYDSENRALYYKANDKGGYSYKDGVIETTTVVAEAVKANFDNNNFMTFYPTEDGEYKVAYSAEDSTGKYEEGNTANKTVKYAYNVRVSDTTAPVYKKMDESLIPSTWGRSVYKYSEAKDNETEGKTISEKIANTDIQFPIPELYDNKDADKVLRVSFTLSDKNSKTVMSFDNIYSSDAKDGKYAATVNFGNEGATYYFFRYWLSKDYEDGNLTVDAQTGKITGGGLGDNAYSLVYYDKDAEAVTKGFFNFSLWKADDSLGQYTVTYRAKDSQGNSSTKTYNINLQNRFEDTTLPSVDFNEPDYFVFRNYETEQSITDVSATDSNDARLDVKYYLVFNMNFTAETDGSYDFDRNIPAANVVEWENKGNLVELSATLGTNKAKLEKTAGGAYTFTIDDKEGEEKVVTLDINNYKNVYVAMKATDSAGNTSSYMKAVKVVDGTTDTAKTYAPAFGDVNKVNGKVGEEYNFGSFQIKYANSDDRAYTGFELYVQRVKAIKNGKHVDVENEPLTNVSFETYSDSRTTGGTDTLYVDNIRFTPSKSGTYMIVVRGFHVSGASSVAMFFREVDGTESDNVPAGKDKAVLGDKLNYNTTYSLPDDYTCPASWAGRTGGLLRSVTGGRFTLMGSEFTAKATTTYNFSDYAFEYTNTNGTIGTVSNNGTNGVNLASLIKYNYQGATGQTSGVCYGLSLAKDAVKTADRDSLIKGEYESKSNYSSTFTDTQSATFRLIDKVMPTYVAITKGAEHSYVELPNISASSVNGNATDIMCEVTDPKGNPVEVYGAEDELPADFKGTLVGNQFMFEATTNGAYTVNYTATLNNQQATASYTIKAGDVIAPKFKVGVGYVNDVYYGQNTTISASVNDTFDFASITDVSDSDNESTSDLKYSKKLITPENETLAEVTSQTKKNNGSSYTFTLGGTYQVVYSVTDAAGNTSTIKYSITVTSSSSNVSTEAITTLSVVLIVVGVLLIAGIIVYLVRFRKRKPAKASA